jgi:hypothetical protein
MTTQLTRIEQQIRRSGMLIGIGLIAELVSLLWNHPTAFFLFLGAGAVLIAAGILYYFYAIVSGGKSVPEADRG